MCTFCDAGSDRLKLEGQNYQGYKKRLLQIGGLVQLDFYEAETPFADLPSQCEGSLTQQEAY